LHDSIGTGKSAMRMPNKIKNEPKNFPVLLWGIKSPINLKNEIKKFKCQRNLFVPDIHFQIWPDFDMSSIFLI